MAGHTHFDESTEEYLEAIYRLDREGPGVTTSGLAADLGVAPASVSGMLKKLASEGYLAYVARGEAKLTERGLSVAQIALAFVLSQPERPFAVLAAQTAAEFREALAAARITLTDGDRDWLEHGDATP